MQLRGLPGCLPEFELIMISFIVDSRGNFKLESESSSSSRKFLFRAKYRINIPLGNFGEFIHSASAVFARGNTLNQRADSAAPRVLVSHTRAAVGIPTGGTPGPNKVSNALVVGAPLARAQPLGGVRNYFFWEKNYKT